VNATPIPPTPTPWWKRNDQLDAVLGWLLDHGSLPIEPGESERDAIRRFLREPWKHEAAYQAMRASDPAIQRARN
jgi:hypothetical protein